VGPGSGAWVGREDELSRLRAAVRDAAAGTGSALVIEGEPGAGKTALLDFAARQAARHGLRILRGAADELARDVPLLPLLESVAELDDPAASDAGPDAQRILALIQRLCAETPVLLILDDLHWADPASLAAWLDLTRLTQRQPLLLAAARWPAVPDPAASAATAPSGTAVLRLGPLGTPETDRLVERLAGAPAGARLTGLARLADGNPRLLHDLVGALSAEGLLGTAGGFAEVAPGTGPPAQLLKTVAEGLTGLPPEVRATLRPAALLGRRFAVADLAELLGRDPAELEPLLAGQIALGLLADGRLGPRFRKALIQQALYDDIPVALRAVLHERAARILAGRDAPVRQVARHLLEAGEPAEDWALDWLAAHAGLLTLQAPALGRELFQRAVDRVPDGHPAAPALWKHLVAAAYRTGRPEAAELTRRLAARSADPDDRAYAEFTLRLLLLDRGQPEPAAQPASGADGWTPPDRWSVRFAALRARALAYQGSYAEAERLAAEAARDAHPRDQLVACTAAQVRARARLAGRDYVGALAAVDDGLAAVRAFARQVPETELYLLADRAALLAEFDRLPEALAGLERARALARRTEAFALTGLIGATAAGLHYAAGRWDAALDEIDAVCAEPQPPQALPPLRAHALAALILTRRGRDDEADARLERCAAAPLRAGEPLARSTPLLLARALRAEAEGRPSEALAVLAAVLDPAAARDLERRHLLLPDLVRLALALDDVPRARTAVSAAQAEAAAAPGVLSRAAAAQRCHGLLTQDTALLHGVLEYYRAVPRAPDLARALEDLAAVTAARGDLETARAHLNQAVDLYTELGALGDVARADIRLRSVGVRRGRRRSARPGDGWAALTPTEVKVAGLVAKGRSNREIGATLSLSPRTVQTHVSHILAKLGAASRSQIAREAATHLPAAPRDR
jgi:DNA-binding CsgD family transcriptional regulator